MAKKTVATLQTASKRLTKAIKMVKSPKTGAYTFVESIMTPEEVDEFLKKKYIIKDRYNKAISYGSSFFIFIFVSNFIDKLENKLYYLSHKKIKYRNEFF